MTLSITDAENHCELCHMQGVTWRIRSNVQFVPLDAERKRALFHEACDDCNDSNSTWDIPLCDSCQHIRFRHLLVCFPKRFPHLFANDVGAGVERRDLELSIQPFSEASEQCALCKFWIACMEDNLHQLGYEENEKLPQHILEKLRITICGSFDVECFTGNILTITRMRMNPSDGRQWRVPTYVDFDWLKGCLHDLTEPETGRNTTLSLDQKVHALRGINVSESCVEHIPLGYECVALSYVWGADSVDQVRCLKSNVDTMAKPGQLDNVMLPRTISDAMMVCRRLGHRYLWVDRLCIVQDDSPEELSKQLNQMASIYHHAAFTIVAVTGSDASHGLAGVSYARDAQQILLKCREGVELVSSTPGLETILEKSKWWTRGWTYQEYVASRRLLFFTDYGLYINSGIGTTDRTQAEGPIASQWGSEARLDLELLEVYTRRALTHETDVLRASSGILQALYGDRTVFGMPLDEFDSAILWTPLNFDRTPRKSTPTDPFPTWSWASSMSPVKFRLRRQPIFSLAFWGIVDASVVGNIVSPSWTTLPPNYDDVAYQKTVEPDPTLKACYIVSGLAWLHGCVRSNAPKSLLVDCTREEYAERLEKSWGNPPSLYWNDAFLSYDTNKLFASHASSSFGHDKVLMVHTQKASFSLDRRGRGLEDSSDVLRPGLHPVIVRTTDNGIAGSMELDDYSIRRLQRLGQEDAEFIALSVCDSERIRLFQHVLLPFITRYFSHLSVAAFYGCPCSARIGESVEADHVIECPKHKDFHYIEPENVYYFGNILSEDVKKDHDQAYAHHLARLSYRDIDGEVLHDPQHAPYIWVMLVAPTKGREEGRKTYQRLGIGRIYLKRWVEASPTFETLMLE